jgi:LysR family glycine cleavage system transcriptional activator
MRAPNNLNALRAFEATARHSSYVTAAEELNVTPAAVGQLVRGLEEYLGVALFHRALSGPARLTLTEAARAVLPELQSGFDQLSLAVSRLKASVERQSITVTVPPAFADKWLLSRVERFQALHPQFDLILDTNGRIVDFNTDRVDVGIRYGAGRWSGLKATRLFCDTFFPVCSPALLAGEHPLRSAADLPHHALIHDASMRFEASFPTWRGWLAKAGIKGIHAEKGLQINDSAAVVQAAIAGRGVALGRSSLVQDDLAAGRLMRPFGDSQPFEFAYFVVCKDDIAPSPAVAAFRDWMVAEAQLQRGH